MDDISPNRDASESDDDRGRRLSEALVAARQKGPAGSLADGTPADEASADEASADEASADGASAHGSLAEGAREEDFGDEFSLDELPVVSRIGAVGVSPSERGPDDAAEAEEPAEDKIRFGAEFIGPLLPAEGAPAPVVSERDAANQAEVDEDAAPALTEPGEVAKVAMAVLLTVRDGMTRLRLAEACNATQKLVDAGLDQLEADLRSAGLPLAVRRHGETIRLMTLPEVFPYLRRLKASKRTERLSPAALETLAVIAYRQPVIRAEIEAIRGVKVGPMLRTLLEHNLVGVVGRKDVPGRPLQYGTTQQFLDRFGLASLDELPSLSEFRSLG